MFNILFYKKYLFILYSINSYLNYYKKLELKTLYKIV